MSEDLELQDSPPRNLRTNPEQTLDAMAVLETEEWRRQQGEEEADRHHHSVANALRWLRGAHAAPGAHFEIYGWGGMNRWWVFPDGRVVFCRGLKAGGDEHASRARAQGFEVIDTGLRI
jgi:hypothetical protein